MGRVCASGRDMVATLGAPLGTLGGPKLVPGEFQQKIFRKIPEFLEDFSKIFAFFFLIDFPLAIIP